MPIQSVLASRFNVLGGSQPAAIILPAVPIPPAPVTGVAVTDHIDLFGRHRH